MSESDPQTGAARRPQIWGRVQTPEWCSELDTKDSVQPWPEILGRQATPEMGSRGGLDSTTTRTIVWFSSRGAMTSKIVPKGRLRRRAAVVVVGGMLKQGDHPPPPPQPNTLAHASSVVKGSRVRMSPK